MKAPGAWAGLGATLLLLAAPLMVAFGVISSIAPPDGAPEAPDRLVGGGVLAAIGALVTSVLLLIGRLRPENRRRGWRIAAFVVMVVTLVLGPLYGIGSYFWVTNVGA